MLYNKEQVLDALKAPIRGNLVTQVATGMFEALNTPFSLACSLLLKHGEFAQLVNMKANLGQNNPEKDILAESLLCKYKDFKHTDLSPEATARASFRDAEIRNRNTNKRLRKLMREARDDDPDFILIRDVADEISNLLGDFDADEWHRNMSFGPGKSIGTDSERVSPYYKMKARPTYCGQDLELAMHVVKACPSWAEIGKDLMLVAAAKLRFVPKSAKTLRSILIEPIVNLFMQKGLGKMFRTRLLRWMVDLNFGDQTQRDLALYGSVSGAICTLDLRNASNTICSVLPRLLFPPKWYAALASCRSPWYHDQETNRAEKLEMFSSMGNGFTFELESLIFMAIARVVVRRHQGKKGLFLTNVFGDDIIVPSESVHSLKKAFELFGFEINEDKTHSEGYFRESCGGNYYNGDETSTLFIKDPAINVSDAYRLANRLHDRAISATNAEIKHCLERGRRIVVAAIPKPARALKYPDYLGIQDSGLACPVNELSFDHWNRDLQLWVHKSYSWSHRPINSRMENIWSAKAYMLYNVESAVDWSIYSTSRISIRQMGRKPKLFNEFGITPHRGRKAAQLCTVEHMPYG